MSRGTTLAAHHSVKNEQDALIAVEVHRLHLTPSTRSRHVGPRKAVEGSPEPTEESTAEGTSNRCETCGAPTDAIPSGCDRMGRIVGGLGSVPGFSWFPLKAYRPCPAAAQAGVQYTRKGQITDDIFRPSK
ncbi:hypothetical protein ACKKBF_B32555 [Auxenochlorella protothecoides x Auxenochlorella symbiontica]